jgi:hypothetical protein
MRYLFVKTASRVLSPEAAERLLEDKFNEEEMPQGSRLIEAFAGREVHLFHLSKAAANREARALFSSGAVLEDHVYGSPEVARAEGGLLPELMPLVFLFMDSDTMFERAMELLYSPSECTFTAGDFLQAGSEGLAGRVLETCLTTTAGESILRVVFDRDGQLVPREELVEVDQYAHCKVSAHCQSMKYNISGAKSWREAAQFELLLSSRSATETSLSFVAEGESHHLYEVRVHKLHQRGEVATAARLEAIPLDADGDDSGLGEDGGEERKHSTKRGTTVSGQSKRVRFQGSPGAGQGQQRE